MVQKIYAKIKAVVNGIHKIYVLYIPKSTDTNIRSETVLSFRMECEDPPVSKLPRFDLPQVRPYPLISCPAPTCLLTYLESLVIFFA